MKWKRYISVAWPVTIAAPTIPLSSRRMIFSTHCRDTHADSEILLMQISPPVHGSNSRSRPTNMPKNQF